jgi:hypothetical protein
MLSGVTGGVFPPPPQASSNPDRKKLDTKARELNRITSSQSVRKASLPHSAFVERVPGARAAFAGDAEAAYGMARRRNVGNDLPIRGQAGNTLFPSIVACKDYVEAEVRWIRGAEAGRMSSDSRESWQEISRRDSLDAKLMTSIFHGISTISSARCQRLQ